MPEMPSANDAQISATFFTKDSNFVIPDTEYSLPINTIPSLLNNLIKTIIHQDNSHEIAEIDFEFLINGKILDTSLETFIQTNNLTIENVLNIEIIKRLTSPDPKCLYLHGDWVSCVDSFIISDNGNNRFFLSGSYDGTINLWNYDEKHFNHASNDTSTAMNQSQLLMNKVLHQGPIKDVKIILVETSKKNLDTVTIYFVTASHDQTVKGWKLNFQYRPSHHEEIMDENTQLIAKTLQCLAIYRGHINGLECLSITPEANLEDKSYSFYSGSWDNTIKQWQFSKNPETTKVDMEIDGVATTKMKKNKLPIKTLSHHSDVVTSLIHLTPNELCSASWDQTIKIWDIEKQKIKQSIKGQKAHLDISYNTSNSCLLSASTDSHIRLWDLKSEVGTFVTNTFSSHKGWVTCVNWSPIDNNIFCSGSYDSLIKIWDIRNPNVPLYNLYGQKGKILCNIWTNPENLIVSGGSDDTLQIFKIK